MTAKPVDHSNVRSSFQAPALSYPSHTAVFLSAERPKFHHTTGNPGLLYLESLHLDSLPLKLLHRNYVERRGMFLDGRDACEGFLDFRSDRRDSLEVETNVDYGAARRPLSQ
jgi:hypothetical protein